LAWFRNYYVCDRCDYHWEDEWSCTSDDDCPHCARHMSPYQSDDADEPLDDHIGFGPPDEK
jgi:hypothetical protein